MVMSEADAIRQDIRPLRIGLLNLMPNKIKTETQFARLVGATPLQVELTLMQDDRAHAEEHAGRPHDRLLPRPGTRSAHEKFDGFIVTGAPVELLEFEDVTYWDELAGSSTGRRPMCIRPSASAGARRRPSTTFTASRKHRLSRQGVRRLPPPATSTRPRPICGAFRMISRYRCRAGPRCAVARLPPRCRARGADGIGRGRPVPGRRTRAHRALYMFNHIEYDTARWRRNIGATPTTASPSACR